jgi:septal ring factor EnvC (AmiA/AmiB activator)
LFIAKQLTDKSDELEKLREEWLCSDTELNQKDHCCQEAMLNREIKDLETYISSLQSEIDMLHKEQNVLQQRVSR